MLPRTLSEWAMLAFVMSLIAAVYFTSLNPNYYAALKGLWL
jgi:hypothetical protein